MLHFDILRAKEQYIPATGIIILYNVLFIGLQNAQRHIEMNKCWGILRGVFVAWACVGFRKVM